MPVVKRRELPPKLERLRKRMDRLNKRLVRKLQARARLVQRIAALKREFGLPAADPRRERAMLQRALDEAPEGFSRAELRRILRVVFVESRGMAVRHASRRKRKA